METLISWDIELLLWLNDLNHPYLDQVMFFLSEKKVWIPFYLLLIYLVFRVEKWRIWIFALTVAATIGLSDGFTSKFMKPYFERLRPSHNPEIQEEVHVVNAYRGGKFGFASSHAANTFALALLLWFLYRRYWPYVGLMFVWAALVSYTRIYLGVHFPLDILVGALVGMACAFLMSRFYFYLHQKIYPG